MKTDQADSPDRPAPPPGALVRVIRGQHEGRVGTVVDRERRVEAIRTLLLQSPTRDQLLQKLVVADGHLLVDLQVDERVLGAGMAAIPVGDLREAP